MGKISARDMFNEAANAAEVTPEDERHAGVKTAPATKESVKVETKQVVQPEQVAEAQPVKTEPKRQEPVFSEPKNEPVLATTERPKNLVVSGTGDNVSREFIEKVLVLNQKYAQLEKETQMVLQSYFIHDEEPQLSALLRNAIYADESSFTGLSLISKVYNLEGGAQKAFFLMGVDNSELGYIYNELSSFVEVEDISGKSKLEACQLLEAAISNINEKNIGQIANVAEFLAAAQ